MAACPDGSTQPFLSTGLALGIQGKHPGLGSMELRKHQMCLDIHSYCYGKRAIRPHLDYGKWGRDFRGCDFSLQRVKDDGEQVGQKKELCGLGEGDVGLG